MIIFPKWVKIEVDCYIFQIYSFLFSKITHFEGTSILLDFVSMLTLLASIKIIESLIVLTTVRNLQMIKFIMLRVQIGLNFILKFCPIRQCESPPSLHGTYKEGLVYPFSKKYIANSTPIAQNIRQKLRNF